MGRKVSIEHEEMMRTGAQKEYDIARRRVYVRSAVITTVIMVIGFLIGATAAYYMGWFGYPDVSEAVRKAFVLGCIVTLISGVVPVVLGAIAVYRRHLVRVSKRMEQAEYEDL